MIELIIQIGLIAFLLNVVWEMNHAPLYTTCHNLSITKNARLLTIQSAKDAFFILLFYGITVFIFDETAIFINIYQLALFVLLGLSFSFIDEKVSIKKHRWEYTDSMPTVFGVGITPLLEIAVTGILTFLVVFYLF
tara:strand:- start:10009 stop:10416 length:408 start_codon:yes stop_codon:yes gene_type:complete